MKTNTRGVCSTCGFQGITVSRGVVDLCPICIVEFTEIIGAFVRNPHTHTAILAGQQFYLRGGQSLKEALTGLKERL